MSEHTPASWVIVKFKGDDPHYRVLGGWGGSYIYGSSWRMNSGIVNVGDTDEGGQHIFHGTTGSTYRCGKDSYGIKMSMAGIWAALQNTHGDQVELMPHDTDWTEIDWIIS